MQLSKSDYLTYLKHPAWLWLKKNRKEILPAPSGALQALFDAGHAYEAYAEQLFEGGVRLGFDNYREYQSLPERTKDALANGANTIFQGRFENGQTTCIVDVLTRVVDDLFDLYEIKSGTSVKAEHIPDLAFQASVLEGAGLKLRNIGVVHANREYTRAGDIDLRAISKIEDVTNQVAERKPQTLEEIEQALGVATQAQMPDPSPRYLAGGDMAEWMEIYAALNGEPDKYSIYNLASVKPDQIGAFEDAGIANIASIPDDAKLTKGQARQVSVTKSNDRLIDAGEIGRFLAGLTYPLYFLDYETFAHVVPPFDRLRPYQQVPFQYSLHIINEPGAAIEHREYLHSSTSNPAAELVERLKQDIGEQGSVIVWYAPFETGRNRELAEMLEEHADYLNALNDRVVDLMVPFKSGWYVDKAFMGSSSIKKVLPVLVPELTYEGLAINNGELAQRAWMDMYLEGKPAVDEAKLLDDLRKYCELDTLAMVRIFEVLQGV